MRLTSPFPTHTRKRAHMLTLPKKETRTRLTLLTHVSTEARVAITSVIIYGLYTFTMATAGCLGTGSYGKHNPCGGGLLPC